MSAFTCAACGGFKYNQTPVLLINQDLKICIDCYENGVRYVGDSKLPDNYGIPVKKPGLHEVLVSIHADQFFQGGTYDEWIQVNGGEEETAKKVREHFLGVWRYHYEYIIGEPWT